MENINNISMKEWAACDRPSYKMKEHGTEAMTNAELRAKFSKGRW